MNVDPISSFPAAAPVAHVPAGSFSPKALRNASPAEQRKAVAQQFEAILVRQLLGKTMTSMLGSSEGDVASSVYGDMLCDTFSQQLTAGGGMGLGRFLEKQLTPRGEQASVTSQPLSAHSSSPVATESKS